MHELDRDPALERLVERPVDGRHATRAKPLLETEAPLRRVPIMASRVVSASARASWTVVRSRDSCPSKLASSRIPACPWSWAAEPPVRKLMVEFGESLAWTWVMGGLARDFTRRFEDARPGSAGSAPPTRRSSSSGWRCRRAAGCRSTRGSGSRGRSGPRTRRAWPSRRRLSRRPTRPTATCERSARASCASGASSTPPRRSWRRPARRPGCRALPRRPLLPRDRGGLRSRPRGGARRPRRRPHGRGPGGTAGVESVSLRVPSSSGEDGSEQGVFGPARYGDSAPPPTAAGARPRRRPPPSIADALRRFGRMATREVEVVCDLPEPRAAAELWRMAADWHVRPVPVLTGRLWEPA